MNTHEDSFHPDFGELASKLLQLSTQLDRIDAIPHLSRQLESVNHSQGTMLIQNTSLPANRLIAPTESTNDPPFIHCEYSVSIEETKALIHRKRQLLGQLSIHVSTQRNPILVDLIHQRRDVTQEELKLLNEELDALVAACKTGAYHPAVLIPKELVVNSAPKYVDLLRMGLPKDLICRELCPSLGPDCAACRKKEVSSKIHDQANRR
jgi:hypothetical protein